VRQINNGPGTDATRGAGKPRFLGLPLSRGAILGITAAAVIAASGLAAVSFLGTGHGTTPRPKAAAGTVGAGGWRAGGDSTSATLMPKLAAAPQVAVMPKSASRSSHTPKSKATVSHSVSPSSHPTPSATSASPSSSPSSTATVPPPTGSASCTHPQYTTSDPNGMWNQDPYFVANDAWNASNYSVTQTLYACSYSNWYVVASMNNNSGDGAVKTYPNSHRDFDNSPRINSFNSITSTFAETGPGTGIYEDAYDIWLNGIASSSSTEVMIWNENHGQTPGGSEQGTATIDGRSYTVWRSGSYIAFVASANFSSATMNLLGFFKWIMAKGWISSNSTLGQVDYGVELVSTNNVPEKFSVSDFSVSAD
jgi:glycosyl hydrolase family 12